MFSASNDIRQYSKPGNIPTDGCNSIYFENQGDVTAIINNVWRLIPGQARSLNQLDPRVIDSTNYYISFDASDPYTTGTNKNLVVIPTFIIDQQNKSGNGHGSIVCN